MHDTEFVCHSKLRDIFRRTIKVGLSKLLVRKPTFSVTFLSKIERGIKFHSEIMTANKNISKVRYPP